MAPILLTALPAQAASTVVAHWTMDDAPMSDDSGNGNDGTLTDVSVVPGGVSGNAYSFAGSNSHVTVPDSPTLDPGKSDFSYTVHVKFSAVPSKTVGDYDVIRKGLAGTSGGEWKMEILPNANTGAANPFCLFKDDATHTDTIRGGQNLADDQWHEITCVKTSTTNQLIVDGTTKTSTPSTPLGSISNSAPVVIGQKWGGGDQYAGLMDEVSVTLGGTVSPTDGDTTAPTVTAKAPDAGSTGISTTTDVTATFSEPVQNVTNKTVKLRKSGTSTLISATVTYDSGSYTATLHPDAALTANTKYTATLTAGIKDLAGNALKATYWNFTTGTSGGTTDGSDSTPPTVTAMTPAAGSTGISTTTDVTATFSEPVQNVTNKTVKLKKSGTSTLIPATVTYNSGSYTATLHPDAALTANTKYTATLTAGIKDLAGNALKATYWAFTTGTSGGTTDSGPTLTAGSPADSTTGVARWTNVVATFSEPVQKVGGSTFTLAPTAGGAAIAGAYSSNTSGTRWVLNPNAGLASKTSYTVTLVGGAGGITDASGTPLTTTSWTFTTG